MMTFRLIVILIPFFLETAEKADFVDFLDDDDSSTLVGSEGDSDTCVTFK
jgi:hypothetical protein